MGWLPEIPLPNERVYCSMCKVPLRGENHGEKRDEIYYIMWTPDSDDPEQPPDNLYTICRAHKKVAQQVNKCIIEIPPSTYTPKCCIQ